MASKRKSTTPKGGTHTTNNSKKRTKSQMILRHLETHKRGITSMDAFTKYNATRLSSIIFNLRHQGYNIISIRETGKDGVSYARYILKETA